MALTDKKTNVVENEVVTPQIPSENPEMENTPQSLQNTEFDGDIDLSTIRKKRFRINGDNNTILELNTSDMSIVSRLDKLYPKLQQLSQDAAVQKLNMEEFNDDSSIKELSDVLKRIDMAMRDIVDEIFDSNVSEVCVPEGSMFDPFNGEFRFEHIIDVLSKLYENNFNAEFKKMSARLKKKTSKYTKGK